MIFDPVFYFPEWVEDFPLGPDPLTAQAAGFAAVRTAQALGSLRDTADQWHWLPGFPGDPDLESALLLHGGFLLEFANAETVDVWWTETGVAVGRLPAGSRPELFASDRAMEREGDFVHLRWEEKCVGLLCKDGPHGLWFALGERAGAPDELRSMLETALPDADRLREIRERALESRTRACAQFPDAGGNLQPGAAMERLLSWLRLPTPTFPHLWIGDPGLAEPVLNTATAFAVLPAIAAFRPDLLPELLRGMLELPANEQGGWSAVYVEGQSAGSADLAPPLAAQLLRRLIPKIPDAALRRQLAERCRAQVRAFIPQGVAADAAPRWPSVHTAFTPEVTDPELEPYDLAAMLVAEMEACAELSDDADDFAAEAGTLRALIWSRFWCGKRLRLFDRTREGELAARLTAGTLLPLLWQAPGKPHVQALESVIIRPEELRAPTGLRQWQERKEDPVEPPVRGLTQLLLLPLLSRLPAEHASLLSADWHRLLAADPHCRSIETAALTLGLLPFESRINPKLERYPVWVRHLEKHRESVMAVAAAILLLLPAGFGIAFATRSDFNRVDEHLEQGTAETLMSLGNLEEAEASYTRLLQYTRSPVRFPKYHLDRGNIRFFRGDYAGALADYLRACELDPDGNYYKARWNLAQTHARLGDKTKAVATLREFMEEYGEEVPHLRQRAEQAIRLYQP